MDRMHEMHMHEYVNRCIDRRRKFVCFVFCILLIMSMAPVNVIKSL